MCSEIERQLNPLTQQIICSIAFSVEQCWCIESKIWRQNDKENEIKFTHKEIVTLIAIKLNFYIVERLSNKEYKIEINLMHKKSANFTSHTMLMRHYCFCDPNQVFMYLFSFFELQFEYAGNRRELKTKIGRKQIWIMYIFFECHLCQSQYLLARKMSNQPVKIKTTHRLLWICVWQGHLLAWHSFHWKCGLKILLIWAVDDSTIVKMLKIAQRHIGFSIALVFDCCVARIFTRKFLTNSWFSYRIVIAYWNRNGKRTYAHTYIHTFIQRALCATV